MAGSSRPIFLFVRELERSPQPRVNGMESSDDAQKNSNASHYGKHDRTDSTGKHADIEDNG